jgi:hypothetical protein
MGAESIKITKSHRYYNELTQACRCAAAVSGRPYEETEPGAL